eukprot:3452887-Amphidinium_carterae.1
MRASQIDLQHRSHDKAFCGHALHVELCKDFARRCELVMTALRKRLLQAAGMASKGIHHLHVTPG